MVTFLTKTVDELRLADPSGKCLDYTPDGHPYEEMACLYPSFGWTFFKFERTYDCGPALRWIQANQWFPYVAVIGYLAMIFGGQAYFHDRKPLNWRQGLIVWNFLLCVFSTWGFLRTFPALVHYALTFEGPADWYCTAPENTIFSGSTGMWFQLWVLSKFPEFIDTVFLVVHKKKLIFLHPFHHIVTFFGSFWGYLQSPPPLAIAGVVMNYGVHAVMYMYYMLMAMKCKPKWFNPFWITAGQLGQMVVGVGLGGFARLFSDQMPDKCNKFITDMMKTTVIIYFAFGLLFAKIFLERYFASSRVKSLKCKAA